MMNEQELKKIFAVAAGMPEQMAEMAHKEDVLVKIKLGETELLPAPGRNRMYLQVKGLRLVFEEGKYIGWYVPGGYPLAEDDPNFIPGVITED